MVALNVLGVSDFGPAPDTKWNINGGSYQQDALASYKGWQYVVFWRDLASKSGVRLLVLGRRRLPDGAWDSFEFDDYEQTEDDGHNVPSLGICAADGTIHLSFDLHDTPLNYRHSLVDLLNDPATAAWGPSSFSAVLHRIPDLESLSTETYFENVTYPRFVSLSNPSGGLLFEYRVGISGLGNDLIFIYDGATHRWTKRGVYLEGAQNNAYINGIDVDKEGAVHVSWCYRDYVPVTLEQSRQQAGPNGPENNHDLCYAYSPPEADGSPGLNWYSLEGKHIGTSDVTPILPSTPGIIAFEIPKYGGILNQEAQFVDAKGNFFVLNRELVEGVESWLFYTLPRSSRKWSKHVLPVLPPAYISSRGKIFGTSTANEVAVILPLLQEFVVLSCSDTTYEQWSEALRIPGAGGTSGMEPVFDRYHLDDSVLSLFLGIHEKGGEGRRMKVLDFGLD